MNELMNFINSASGDPAMLFAMFAMLASGIALIGLRILSKRTGVPTQDIEDLVEVIHEQAVQDVKDGIQRHSVRDPETGKFISTKQKVLPDGSPQADTPPKEEEKPEDEKEADTLKKSNIINAGLISLILFMWLPFFTISCSLIDAGYQYASDNVEITWKGDEATEAKPIDSIVVKFDPVYWKETGDSFIYDSLEAETEFTKDGYRVWQLRTPNWKRLEVQRLDTIIYIYKK